MHTLTFIKKREEMTPCKERRQLRDVLHVMTWRHFSPSQNKVIVGINEFK
mgnify:CR=1 FL=1